MDNFITTKNVLTDPGLNQLPQFHPMTFAYHLVEKGYSLTPTEETLEQTDQLYTRHPIHNSEPSFSLVAYSTCAYMHKFIHRPTYIISYCTVYAVMFKVKLPRQTCLRDRFDSLSTAEARSSLSSRPLNCSISPRSEALGTLIRLISSSDCTSASRASAC